MHGYANTHVHIYMRTCIYIYIYIYIYTYVYIHAYTHTHTHACMHTYIHAFTIKNHTLIMRAVYKHIKQTHKHTPTQKTHKHTYTHPYRILIRVTQLLHLFFQILRNYRQNGNNPPHITGQIFGEFGEPTLFLSLCCVLKVVHCIEAGPNCIWWHDAFEFRR